MIDLLYLLAVIALMILLFLGFTIRYLIDILNALKAMQSFGGDSHGQD